MPVTITYNDPELQTIAKYQRAITWLIVLFAFSDLSMLLTDTHPIPLIRCGVLITKIVFLYRFARKLKESSPWIYAATGSLPFLGLLIAGLLQGKAARLLKAGGYRVGFLGASQNPATGEALKAGYPN